MSPGDLLTTSQVAAILRCSTEHVRREIQRGRLVGVRVGAHWRVTASSLEAYCGAGR